jgi:hypothetical protein
MAIPVVLNNGSRLIPVDDELPVTDYYVRYKANSSQFSSLDDGDDITNWLPESGGSHSPSPVKVGTALYRPSVASLNNKAAIEFDLNGFVHSIANINFNGLTIFLVSKVLGDGSANRTPLGSAQNTRTQIGQFYGAVENYKPVILLENKFKIHPSDVTAWPNDQTPCLVSIAINSTDTEKSFINGFEINSTAGDAGPMATSSLGQLQISGYHSEDYAYANAYNKFKGYVSEVVIYNRVLDPTELSDTHTFLLNKYGLSPYSQ